MKKKNLTPKTLPAYLDHGLDMRKAVAPMWAALMRSLRYPNQKRPPKEVRFHRKGYGSGFSYDDIDRVTVSVTGGLANTVMVLLHELCHKAVGNQFRHGERYNRALRLASFDLWPSFTNLGGVRRMIGYDLSKELLVQLEKELKENGSGRILEPLGLVISLQPKVESRSSHDPVATEPTPA